MSDKTAFWAFVVAMLFVYVYTLVGEWYLRWKYERSASHSKVSGKVPREEEPAPCRDSDPSRRKG